VGNVIAAVLVALSVRSPRALFGAIVTLLVVLYIWAQVELHRARVKLEQQDKQDVHQHTATARPVPGRE
jgi:hypothetical protein